MIVACRSPEWGVLEQPGAGVKAGVGTGVGARQPGVGVPVGAGGGSVAVLVGAGVAVPVTVAVGCPWVNSPKTARPAILVPWGGAVKWSNGFPVAMSIL